MGEILFLSHRIPFPPDRGDKIRSHHVLRRLARLAPVHVATFADDDLDMGEESHLSAMASSYCLRRRRKPLALAGIEALVRSRPVSLTAFHDRELASYVASVLNNRPIAAIYVFSGQMAQYVPEGFPGKVVVDFVDVDSAKFEAYAHQKGGIRGWIDAREARLLQAEEAWIAQRAHISLLVSRAETHLFRQRLPTGLRSQIDVRAMANGIDSAGFDPAQVGAERRMLAIPGPRIIFTGQMDYPPNVEAAHRVIGGILPRLRADCPTASFHVVGRNPPSSLLRRHGEDGVHVWGRVPDIRTWLKAADLALVPLEIARGVQNKVLEAMAMALPVVLTPGAATGIDAEDGRDFRIADRDADLALAVLDLVQRDAGRKMGVAARSFVVENAAWDAVLADLPSIMGIKGGGLRDAA